MDFWDGVIMGVKEYGKQAVTDLLISGVLKTANFVGSEIATARASIKSGKTVPRIDLGAEITKKYRSSMDAADKALKKSSTAYRGVSGALEKVGVFSSSRAGAARDILDRSAKADAAAELQAKQSIAQRRIGDLGLTPEQMKNLEIHDLAMEDGMNKVRKLYDAMKQHGTARQRGTLPEADAAFEAAWVEV